jgi:hypothetical protein
MGFAGLPYRAHLLREFWKILSLGRIQYEQPCSCLSTIEKKHRLWRLINPSRAISKQYITAYYVDLYDFPPAG